ncbi:hypothetical protein BC937DRAFT_93387 [Endogone sp. FLAS-F59071]|nr:hypothetical protein BC937DRAFT_93387 [Endogone sp. FLAS-F59071]|eukprot:RUS21188.1 hypothetical protein BC937DRAFT_93387 [Endogone sp. FLAS-F59071]
MGSCCSKEDAGTGQGNTQMASVPNPTYPITPSMQPRNTPRTDLEELPFHMDNNRFKVVIAIDFGTTFSGCTWAIAGTTDMIKDIDRWPDQNGTYPKIPTAVVYNSNGEVHAWGQTAQNVDTFNRALGGLQYFNNFKLYLDEKIVRSSELPQLPYGKTPAGIIADFLREMHKFVLGKIPNAYSRDQIRYCLTIPASWSPYAKRTMREAATMADMIKPGDPAERLLLISEPEAAMIYVKEKQPGIEGCRNVMICDAGGGTVDMCTFAISTISSTQKTLQEISLGHGKSCGSVFIDMAMERYIRDVKLGRQVCNAIHPRLVPNMIKYFIDNVKKNFRPETKEYPIPSPVPHDHALCDILPAGTVVDGVEMIFTFEELQKHVFDPVIREILALIRDQIRQLPALSAPDRSSSYVCDKLVLVGGFGESEYLLRKIQEEFMAPGLVRDVETVFNAGLAVVRGAAYFGLRPASVTQRFSRYSYGISVLRAFQPGRDPESKRVVGGDGAMRCDDSFFKYVTKGESIQLSKNVTHEFATFQKERVVDEVPRYTDSPGVFFVGTVNIPQMPAINRVVDTQNPLYIKIHIATVDIDNVNYVANFDFKNALVLNN